MRREMRWARSGLAAAALLFLCASAVAQQNAPAAVGAAPANAGTTVASPANETPIATEDAAEGSRVGRPLQHELSPWSMFVAADAIVKAVMIGLALASVATWTIFFAKTIELGLAFRRLGDALRRIAAAATMGEAREALGRGNNVVSVMLASAAQEWEWSDGARFEIGVQERAASRLADIVRTDSRSIRRGMGALATIGSTAPFVGLFGTVWGIMNSFVGISKSQTTNLAVVAPGIAEALLATACGLVAAIPAVVLYNHFARRARTYADLLARASGAVGRLLSRDIDRARSATPKRAAG